MSTPALLRLLPKSGLKDLMTRDIRKRATHFYGAGGFAQGHYVKPNDQSESVVQSARLRRSYINFLLRFNFVLTWD